MSTQEFSPQDLDVAAFARASGKFEGLTALSQFERLLESLHAGQVVAESDLAPGVAWQAVGYTTQPTGGAFEVRMRLQATATLPLTCQLCLGAVETPIELERVFQFVANESQAAELDEESDDDVLVLSRHFDLLELIEDELLLALPLVPQHEVCPKPLPLPPGLDSFAAPEDSPHPFAELQRLKSSKGSNESS